MIDPCNSTSRCLCTWLAHIGEFYSHHDYLIVRSWLCLCLYTTIWITLNRWKIIQMRCSRHVYICHGTNCYLINPSLIVLYQIRIQTAHWKRVLDNRLLNVYKIFFNHLPNISLWHEHQKIFLTFMWHMKKLLRTILMNYIWTVLGSMLVKNVCGTYRCLPMELIPNIVSCKY